MATSVDKRGVASHAPLGPSMLNGDTFATSIPTVPVTEQRPVPYDLDKMLRQPGLPRANVAVSTQVPEGSSPALARRDYSVIQQHVAFFDRDDDGIIWPWDTYVGKV